MEVERLLRDYGDLLLRVCWPLLQSRADAEDALQETLLRYLLKAPQFADAAHEKAWLIRVAVNYCKNQLRRRQRQPQVALAEAAHAQPGLGEQQREVLLALQALPTQARLVLVLFYLEGYSSREIARLVGTSDAAVRKRLQKARALLKLEWEGGEPDA